MHILADQLSRHPLSSAGLLASGGILPLFRQLWGIVGYVRRVVVFARDVSPVFSGEESGAIADTGSGGGGGGADLGALCGGAAACAGGAFPEASGLARAAGGQSQLLNDAALRLGYRSARSARPLFADVAEHFGGSRKFAGHHRFRA